MLAFVSMFLVVCVCVCVCVWLWLTGMLGCSKRWQYGLHGSINVPCREPIRWKPWERSEPYVSLPVCNRPNIGRVPYFLHTHKSMHTHKNKYRTNTHVYRGRQEYICTSYKQTAIFMCKYNSFQAVTWVKSHLQAALLISLCFDVWGVLKMSEAVRNTKYLPLQSCVRRSGSKRRRQVREKLLNSACFTLCFSIFSWRKTSPCYRIILHYGI